MPIFVPSAKDSFQLQAERALGAAASGSAVRSAVPTKPKPVTTVVVKPTPSLALTKPRTLHTCETGLQTYREISNLVDEILLKKQQLTALESKLTDPKAKLDRLTHFYIKMILVADRVYQHSAWTVFNYNSELYHVRCVTERLFKLIELVEEPEILADLAQSLRESRLENSLKIRLLNFLISRGITPTDPKIELDEHIFEMVYLRLSQHVSDVTQLRSVASQMDRVLAMLFRNNYDGNTGKTILDILDKKGAGKPVFKTNKQRTVTYLANSDVDLKHYGDYLVVSLATLILFDLGEFLGIYLAMERNAEFITRIVSRIGEKSCELVLQKIDPEYQTKVFEKLGTLLFYKSWASFKDVSTVIVTILRATNLQTNQKVTFYCQILSDQTTNPVRANFDSLLDLLIQTASPQLISGVRVKLGSHPVYDEVDQYILQKLGKTREHNDSSRDLISTSFLIRETTLELLSRSPEINWDPENLDSLPNLLRTAQAMSRETTFLIGDDGGIRTRSGQFINNKRTDKAHPPRIEWNKT